VSNFIAITKFVIYRNWNSVNRNSSSPYRRWRLLAKVVLKTEKYHLYPYQTLENKPAMGFEPMACWLRIRTGQQKQSKTEEKKEKITDESDDISRLDKAIFVKVKFL